MTDRPPTPISEQHRATDPGGDVLDFLEAGQLTDNRRVPVPRAQLSARVQAALWALRISVLLLVFMVGYAFVAQLGP